MDPQAFLYNLLLNIVFRDFRCTYGNYLLIRLWEPMVSVLALLMLAVYGLLQFVLPLKSRNNQTLVRINLFNPNDFEALHKATFENDVLQIIHVVLKCPYAINQPHTFDGYTPFMRACLSGNTQVVKLMLAYGADISKRTRRGETPFYLAAFYYIKNPSNKNASCIHTLYYAGSDINATTAKGYTALDLAVTFGHTALVKWLLSKGAQPKRLDLRKVAVSNGHYETALTINNVYH